MNTKKRSFPRTARRLAIGVTAVIIFVTFHVSDVSAGGLVVAHDVNTLGTIVAGPQEAAFATNVASFLTSGSVTKNLLLFESDPSDGRRDFSPVVLEALTNAGFSVTVTADYTTPFASFAAVFVAEEYPSIGFLDNAALINYVNGGGGVYLAGGVGDAISVEAAGWSTFLSTYGLAFETSGYNGLYSVTITSAHPIFAGITSLWSGSGQSIIDLGTNPNAQIVQFVSGQGVYAVVVVPEPTSSPDIDSTVLSGANLVASGSGGVANGTYYVLMSTNVALPLTNWIVLTTNGFDGSGHFAFTNAVTPAVPRRFYIIRLP